MTSTLKERFESKFTRGTDDECWNWQGTKSKNRYGYIGVTGDRVPKLVHRIAYELYIGEIPEGMCVLHHCDNPSCVNPRHLFLGTLSDNTKDCVEKGRWNRPVGEKHYKALLTVKDVLDIRSSTLSVKELAQRYNVKLNTIYHVRDRTKWKSVK